MQMQEKTMDELTKYVEKKLAEERKELEVIIRREMECRIVRERREFEDRVTKDKMEFEDRLDGERKEFESRITGEMKELGARLTGEIKDLESLVRRQQQEIGGLREEKIGLENKIKNQKKDLEDQKDELKRLDRKLNEAQSGAWRACVTNKLLNLSDGYAKTLDTTLSLKKSVEAMRRLLGHVLTERDANMQAQAGASRFASAPPVSGGATPGASNPGGATPVSGGVTSGASNPLGATPLSIVPQDFNSRDSTDRRTPYITDFVELGGKVVLADRDNNCVKLFNLQGTRLDRLDTARGYDCHLARLSDSCAAVAEDVKGLVKMVDVGGDKLVVQHQWTRRGDSSFPYILSLCAAGADSLALLCGVLGGPLRVEVRGQTTGQLHHNIDTGVSGQPDGWIRTTADGDFIVTNVDNVTKISRTKHSIMYSIKVSEVPEPHNLAVTPDGIVVFDYGSKTVCELSHTGQFVRTVWRAPPGNEYKWVYVCVCGGFFCFVGWRGDVHFVKC